ncbi:hypothetical protein [Patulibacter defluvii]|uniref:hypothetical protein n=1 Tax=Patulibacter defluvii TaxID=3095358 RepID=UPI002A747DF8|nr:hypothetical protein [Patulibacter sp. DM4]
MTAAVRAVGRELRDQWWMPLILAGLLYDLSDRGVSALRVAAAAVLGAVILLRLVLLATEAAAGRLAVEEPTVAKGQEGDPEDADLERWWGDAEKTFWSGLLALASYGFVVEAYVVSDHGGCRTAAFVALSAGMVLYVVVPGLRTGRRAWRLWRAGRGPGPGNPHPDRA